MSRSAGVILRGLIYVVLALPHVFMAAAAEPAGPEEEAKRIQYRLTEYSVRASLPIIGDIGRVGKFAIEEEVWQREGRIDKSVRIYGSSKPELAKKGKDYSGELKMAKGFPLDERGEIDWPSIVEGRASECTHSGYFRKNGRLEAESLALRPQYAISSREDGAQKRIEGDYTSFLAALEYLFGHDLREGKLYELKSILGGRPCSVVCTADEPVRLDPYPVKVFPIEIATYDGLAKDDRGSPAGQKKMGAIRLWICKEEPYMNRILRLKIKYKWYLTLRMDMIKAA